jgi:predicted RNA-binding Zn ribbon-like protein
VTCQVDFDDYMDFPVRLAVDLVNTLDPISGADRLADAAAVRAFMEAHRDHWAVAEVDAADIAEVHALRAALREVFAAEDEARAAELLNGLIRRTGAQPRITGHNSQRPHLHFEPPDARFSRWLGAATAMGLAIVLCEFGGQRLGICGVAACRRAFVDTSKNRRKRYCSEACAHRESVAAFRRRQRAAAEGPIPNVRQNTPKTPWTT